MRLPDACAFVALLVLAVGAWAYSDKIVALGVIILFIAGALAVLENDGRPRF